MDNSQARGNGKLASHRRTPRIDLPLRRNSSTLAGPCMGASRGAISVGPRSAPGHCAQADITLPTPAPPQADAQRPASGAATQTTIPLRGHHGGGGTVTFWIVQRPEHGKLSDLRLVGDNRAAIAYENDGAESVTSDRFSYVVKAVAVAPPRPPKCALSWKRLRREWSSRGGWSLTRSWRVRARASHWRSRMKAAACWKDG